MKISPVGKSSNAFVHSPPPGKEISKKSNLCWQMVDNLETLINFKSKLSINQKPLVMCESTHGLSPFSVRNVNDGSSLQRSSIVKNYSFKHIILNNILYICRNVNGKLSIQDHQLSNSLKLTFDLLQSLGPQQPFPGICTLIYIPLILCTLIYMPLNIHTT